MTKRVLELRKVRRDRSKLHLHEYWGADWVFRHVSCGGCGNDWWETISPAWARREGECACGEGST